VLLNVAVREKKPFARLPRVRQRIAQVEKELGERGRVLVRYSGTESLARVMLEGEDERRITQLAQGIVDEIRSELGAEFVNR
jgi:phosphoglucosamine mutase